MSAAVTGRFLLRIQDTDLWMIRHAAKLALREERVRKWLASLFMEIQTQQRAKSVNIFRWNVNNALHCCVRNLPPLSRVLLTISTWCLTTIPGGSSGFIMTSSQMTLSWGCCVTSRAATPASTSATWGTTRPPGTSARSSPWTGVSSRPWTLTLTCSSPETSTRGSTVGKRLRLRSG